MERLIACCGLDCKNCEARIATINNDEKLKEKVAKFWSQLNNVTITPNMINCNGCMSLGVKSGYCNICEIRNCVISKKYNTCIECNSFNECLKLKKMTDNNPYIIDNLKSLI